MKYFCTTDLAWLQEVNSRGHIEGNGTTAWFRILEHSNGVDYAAEIEERQEIRMHEVLTPEECAMVQAGFKDRTYMLANGWNVD